MRHAEFSKAVVPSRINFWKCYLRHFVTHCLRFNLAAMKTFIARFDYVASGRAFILTIQVNLLSSKRVNIYKSKLTVAESHPKGTKDRDEPS
jgi:hypothetical protein